MTLVQCFLSLNWTLPVPHHSWGPCHGFQWGHIHWEAVESGCIARSCGSVSVTHCGVALHKQFLLCLHENHMSLEIQSSCANSVNTNTVLVLRAPGQGRIRKASCSFKGSLAAVSSYSGDVQWCLISMAD